MVFGGLRFDIPMLDAEFSRCGVAWTPANVIDVGNLFKIARPRRLSDALKFYCGRDHTNAHRSMDDVVATEDVLSSMRIEEQVFFGKSDEQLALESNYGKPLLDPAGKLCLDDQGRLCFNFGEHQNKPVVLHESYVEWMGRRDFPRSTMRILHDELASHAAMQREPDDIGETLNMLDLLNESKTPLEVA